MECEHFINSIIYDKPLINGPEIGLNVVKLLEEVSNTNEKKKDLVN